MSKIASGREDFDVVVVGGGPVGLGLTLALAASPGMRVALIDRRPLAGSGDKRAFALSAAVRRVLAGLGAWPALADAAAPIREMRITDSGTGDLARPTLLSFVGDVAPGEPYAHMVEAGALTQALLAALGARAVIAAPGEIEAVDFGAAGVDISLADGRRWRAALLAAADGANSPLRTRAGITTFGHDYHQEALTATLAHRHPHGGTAFEHFRPGGPLATLPLAGNRSSLVWALSFAEAAEVKALPLAEAGRAIEAATGSTLGAITLDTPLQSFPLKLQFAKSLVAPRLALLGDAARTIHPLAGQGLNLGLGDAAQLAEITIEALRLGLDPGASEPLRRYARARQIDSALMAGTTDLLNRLFSNDLPALRVLRDLGLGLVDRTPPLKQALIARAAGLSGRAPRLVRRSPV